MMGSDDQPNPTPTSAPPLPSRERAVEIAAEIVIPDGKFDAKDAADTAAILSAYAAGRLVPVERVSEMRERAAGACQENAGDCTRIAGVYSREGDAESERALKCDADVWTRAATAIRALPLDAAPGGTGGGE